MRTLLLLLLACALVTGCVQAVDPTRFQTPTPTPHILAEVPFATIDVYARTGMDAPAVLPAYVGIPEVSYPGPGRQDGHSITTLDASTAFVVADSDPANPAVAALPAEAQAAVLATDFDQAVVVVLLHWGGGLDDFIFVKDIVLDAEGLLVRAEEWHKPGTGAAVPAEARYPYHVVRVQRRDLPADWTPERYPIRTAVTKVSGDLTPPSPTPVP